MMRNAIIALLCMLALGLAMSSDSSAAIYKYTDKDGLVNLSTDLQAIPEPYRAKAVIVSGEETANDEKAPSSQVQPTERKVSGPTGPGQADPGPVPVQVSTSEAVGNKTSFGRRALISGIVLISALFVFVILGVLDTDNKKAVTVARLVIVWGVSLYVLYAHAMDIVHVFTSVGSKVENVQHESEEKGKRAAKAIKTLDALVSDASISLPND